MKVSKSILDESLRKIEQLGLSELEIAETLKEINEKKPEVADFIISARNEWEDNPPETLEDQLQFLFHRLVTFAGIFSKKEPASKGEKEDYVPYFITGVISSWRKKPPANLRHQVVFLTVHLLTLVDMFQRQKEVNGLEEKFGKYFKDEEKRVGLILGKTIKETLEEIAQRGKIEGKDEKVLISTTALLHRFLQSESDENIRELKSEIEKRQKEVGIFFPSISAAFLTWKEEGREDIPEKIKELAERKSLTERLKNWLRRLM